ncbi:hypothetical protein [Streptosporangium amethystogenes]|uniref:hypothetical protein n=1 Tax=Streptosporangium amethystogenes TaxID=2002 RepID=UPI0012F78CB4|nr:hypothetical protein [Streptosporangium amethystogenes]
MQQDRPHPLAGSSPRCGHLNELDVFDGTGFDETSVMSAPGRGYGPCTMRERPAEVGGRLTIGSTPGAMYGCRGGDGDPDRRAQAMSR